jgi:hypothetical protein
VASDHRVLLDVGGEALAHVHAVTVTRIDDGFNAFRCRADLVVGGDLAGDQAAHVPQHLGAKLGEVGQLSDVVHDVDEGAEVCGAQPIHGDAGL